MLATVASSTSANRLKRRLSEAGIFSAVIQTPHILSNAGCGYCLRFDRKDKEFVEKASIELGIRIRAFYDENISENKINYIKL